jgi:hypothetical protein
MLVASKVMRVVGTSTTGAEPGTAAAERFGHGGGGIGSPFPPLLLA